MKRRAFITTAFAGTAALALSSTAAQAAPHSQENAVFNTAHCGHGF